MKKVVLLLFILAVCVTSSASAQQASFGKTLVDCGVCHISRITPQIDGGAVNFIKLANDKAGDEAICYSCHNGVVRDSRGLLWERFQHPTGIKPRRPGSIRKMGFPLDNRGRIYCGSCHTPHIKGKGIGLFMRFGDESGAFCLRCHPRHDDGPKNGEHALKKIKGEVPGSLLAAGGKFGKGKKIACATCHRIHGAASTFLLSLNPWGSKGLCQSCHFLNPSNDGVGLGNASHPVNVKMAEPFSFVWSRESIASSPSGMVDCWSCHRAHNNPADTPLLVKDLYLGNGCSNCHKDKSSFSAKQGNHPIGKPVKGGQEKLTEYATCLVCHRAHNSDSDQGYLLNYNRSDSNLCLRCHQKYFTRETNHPVEVTKEGIQSGKLESFGAVFSPGKNMSCTTCHRIHDSVDATHALAVEEKILCLYCHQRENYLDSVNAPPGTHPILVPAGETVSPEILEEGGRLSPQGELICTTCHRVHGSAPGSTGLVMDKNAFACTLCHTERNLEAGGKHNLAAAQAVLSLEEGDMAAGTNNCRVCHSEHGWTLDVSDGKENFLTRLCLSCHNQNGVASTKLPLEISHPVGTVLPPDKALTIKLPLYLRDGRRFKKGEVTCPTCHKIHYAGPQENRSLLRMPLTGNRTLCLECHDDKLTVTDTKHDLMITNAGEMNIAGIRADEGGVCSPCHLAHGGFGPSMWARLADGQGDMKAQLCRSCHYSGLIAGKKVAGPFSHPLSSSRDQGTGTIISPGAEAGIRNGVTCASCHDPHRWNPKEEDNRGGPEVEGTISDSFLRWPDDENSSLCQRCHLSETSIEDSAHDIKKRDEKDKSSCITSSAGSSLCGQCHSVHNGKGPLGWPNKLSGEGELISKICRNCHIDGGCAEKKQPGLFSHPIDLSPIGYRGSELPLFDDTGHKTTTGNLSCATCHNLHISDPSSKDENPEKKVEGDLQASFLRLRADGHSPLCIKCHTDKAMIAGTDHDLRVTATDSPNMAGLLPRDSGVCGTCHSVHLGTYDYFLWNRPLGPGSDIITSLCTGCHYEGSIAKNLDRPYVHFVNYKRTDITSPRKIFTLRKGGRMVNDLTIPLFTDAAVKTNHGIITCATCHSVHQWDAGFEMPGKGNPQEGDKSNSFLRIKGSFAILNSFCVTCHPDNAVQKYQNFHTSGNDNEISP